MVYIVVGIVCMAAMILQIPGTLTDQVGRYQKGEFYQTHFDSEPLLGMWVAQNLDRRKIQWRIKFGVAKYRDLVK